MNQSEMSFLREPAEEAIRVGCEEEGLLRDENHETEVEMTLCETLHSRTQSLSQTVVVVAAAACCSESSAEKRELTCRT